VISMRFGIKDISQPWLELEEETEEEDKIKEE